MDKEFKTLELPPISEGVHTIKLKCSYTNDMELENCYIIGDFGVNEMREICEKPKFISLGDITKQGYLHYAGDIDYVFSCNIPSADKEIYLNIGEFKGTCAVAKINGAEIPIPWKANSVVNISEFIKSGEMR